MRLNYDCLRDSLLMVGEYIDAKCEMNIAPVISQDVVIAMNSYTHEDACYAISKLREGEYITGETIPPTLKPERIRSIRITGITFKGHEFLEVIRPKTAWESIKETAKKVGVLSIQSIMEIAVGVMSTAIAAQIGH